MKIFLKIYSLILFMILVLSSCVSTGAKKGSGVFDSIDSIVKAFNDAGIIHYKLDDKTNNSAFKNMYTQFAGGAKVIRIVDFRHKQHSCTIVEFDSDKGPVSYKNNDMIKLRWQNKSENLYLTNRKYLLIFMFGKKSINDKMVNIFKN